MEKPPVNLENSPAVRRILRALHQHGPLDVERISALAFVSVRTLINGRYLHLLMEARLIHIAGYDKKSNGYRHRIYALGPDKSVPRPRFHLKDKDTRGMARVVAALEKYGPMDYKQIASKLSISPNTIRSGRYMAALVQQARVHIVDWRRSPRGGSMSPIYEAGPGTNVRRPPALSAAERLVRVRQKKRLLGQSSLIGIVLSPPTRIATGTSKDPIPEKSS